MGLMLAVIFLCLGVGLLGSRFGPAEHLALVFLAVVMTALYFFSARFL